MFRNQLTRFYMIGTSVKTEFKRWRLREHNLSTRNLIQEYGNIEEKIRSLNPVDTGHKLNAHKMFRRRLGRLLNVLCTFNLRPVSTEKSLMTIYFFCIRRLLRFWQIDLVTTFLSDYFSLKTSFTWWPSCLIPWNC